MPKKNRNVRGRDRHSNGLLIERVTCKLQCYDKKKGRNALMVDVTIGYKHIIFGFVSNVCKQNRLCEEKRVMVAKG